MKEEIRIGKSDKKSKQLPDLGRQKLLTQVDPKDTVSRAVANKIHSGLHRWHVK